MTITQSLTTPTTAPARTQDKDTFNTNVDNFLAWQATNVSELTTWQTQANSTAAAMNALAAGTAVSIPYTFSTTTTDSDPGAGILRLDNATQNISTVIRADLVGGDGSTWSSVIDTFDDSSSAIKGHILLQKTGDGTKWILFTVTSLASPSGYKNITVAVVSASEASPFANNDTLVLKFTRNGDKGEIGTSGGVVREARTSNTILVAADSTKLIDITSGTFTQTFTAAATIAASVTGWYVFLRNSGTGDITLDPNSSETIDGLTSYILYPGECRLIQCDGTGFNSVVMSPFSKTYNSSDTWTKPPGYTRFAGFLWGGGGSGGKINAYGAGGGGGACVPFNILASALSATETVTIGAGGAAISAATTNGNAGGSSTFDTVTAYGGGAGCGTDINYAGGGGGGCFSAGGTGGVSNGTGGAPVPTTGAANVGFGGGSGNTATHEGTRSVYGGAGGSGTNGTGGASLYGGGGGGGGNAGSGGTSLFGGAGGAGSAAGTATAGTQPGGGGGGTASGTSGAGGNGRLVIWGVA